MKKQVLKKIFVWIKNIVFALVILIALSYSLSAKMAPDVNAKIFPFQMYTVVTDSMVPKIPVNSLVITKRISDYDKLKPGDIITFKANRFEKDIVLTHYLDSFEEYEGQTRYRTHAQGTDYKDDYVTLQKDLLGTYVVHIPAIGKLPLFLTSTYGLVLIIVCALIYIFNCFLKSKFNDDELTAQKGTQLKRLALQTQGGCCLFSGEIRNKTKENLTQAKAQLELYDENKQVIYSEEIALIDPDELLAPNKTAPFSHSTPEPVAAQSYRISVTDLSYSLVSKRYVKGKNKKQPLKELEKADA